MSARFGVWELAKERPRRIFAEQVDLEKKLEDWIVNDPSLVQAGLAVIGRQVNVDGTRARLDLLALDPQGQWVVIEIKRGRVSRDTLAQVIDYTACLASLTEQEIEKLINPQSLGHEQNLRELLGERDALESLDPTCREISMIVVGTGRSPELDLMAEFLSSKFGFPLSIVIFNVFLSSTGSQILVRELSEPELGEPSQTPKSRGVLSMDELQIVAEKNGVGEKFKTLKDVAKELGFYARTWKTSVMYAPQSNKTRCLFTVWTSPGQKIKVYVASSAFTEFFQIDDQRVEELVGREGWRYFDDGEVKQFVINLRELMGVHDNLVDMEYGN